MLDKKVNIVISFLFLIVFMCVSPSHAIPPSANNDADEQNKNVSTVISDTIKIFSDLVDKGESFDCDDVVGASSSYKKALEGRADPGAMSSPIPGRICKGDLALNILYSIYQSPDENLETLSSNPIYKLLGLSPSPAIDRTLDKLVLSSTIIKIVILLTNTIAIFAIILAIKMLTKLTLRTAKSGVMLGKAHNGFVYLSKLSIALLLILPTDLLNWGTSFTGITHLVLGLALLAGVLANYVWSLFLSHYGGFLTPDSLNTRKPPLTAAFELSKSQVDALIGYNVCIIKNTERLVYNEMLELENGKNTFTNLPFLKLNNKKTQYESPSLESSLEALREAGIAGVYAGCAEKFFGSASDSIIPENIKKGLIKWGGSAADDAPEGVSSAGVQLENNTLDEFPLLKDNLELPDIRNRDPMRVGGTKAQLRAYDDQMSVLNPDWIFDIDINELVTPDEVLRGLANKPRVMYTVSESLQRDIEEQSKELLSHLSSDLKKIESQPLQDRPDLYKNIILKELMRRQLEILSNSEGPMLKQTKYFANYYHLTSCGKNIDSLLPSWLLVKSYNGGELKKHFDPNTGYKKDGVPKLESFSTDCVAYDIPWTAKAFSNIPFLSRYFSDMKVYLLPLEDRYSRVLESKPWDDTFNKEGAFGGSTTYLSTNKDSVNQWSADEQNKLNGLYAQEREVYLHYLATVLSLFTLRAGAIDAYLKLVDDSGENGQSEYVAQIWKKGWAAAGGFMFDVSKMMRAKNDNIYEIESTGDRTLKSGYSENYNYILPLFSNRIDLSEKTLFHQFYGHESSAKSFYPLNNTSTIKDLSINNSIREKKEFERLNQTALQNTESNSSKGSDSLIKSPYLDPDIANKDDGKEDESGFVVSLLKKYAWPSTATFALHPMALSNRMVSPYKGSEACPTSIMSQTCGVPSEAAMTVLLQYGNDLLKSSVIAYLVAGTAQKFIGKKIDRIKSIAKKRKLPSALKWSKRRLDLIDFILGIFITLLGILIIIGFYISHFLPLIPYVAFLMGVIGWIFVMFQAIIALPVWLISWVITRDAKDSEDHSSYADYKVVWEIFLNILFVPVLLVSGLILAWSLSNYSIYYVNYFFSLAKGMNQTDNPLVGDELLGLIQVLSSSAAYLIIVVIIVHLAFRLIQKLSKEVFAILEAKYAEVKEDSTLESAMVAQELQGYISRLPGATAKLLAAGGDGAKSGYSAIMGGPISSSVRANPALVPFMNMLDNPSSISLTDSQREQIDRGLDKFEGAQYLLQEALEKADAQIAEDKMDAPEGFANYTQFFNHKNGGVAGLKSHLDKLSSKGSVDESGLNIIEELQSNLTSYKETADELEQLLQESNLRLPEFIQNNDEAKKALQEYRALTADQLTLEGGGYPEHMLESEGGGYSVPPGQLEQQLQEKRESLAQKIKSQYEKKSDPA